MKAPNVPEQMIKKAKKKIDKNYKTNASLFRFEYK